MLLSSQWVIEYHRLYKTLLYKTLIVPVLLYGAEAWTLLKNDAAALRAFERKVVRKLFLLVRVGDDFRITYNSDLYEFFNYIDVVQRINIQWLLWLAHVVRMYLCGGLRKSAKRMTLYPLEEPNRRHPVIDWCEASGRMCCVMAN